jgi:hypothetical protein
MDAPEGFDDTQGSLIHLPFQAARVQAYDPDDRASERIQATDEFRARFMTDIRPELLLFLQKLGTIVLHNQITGETCRIASQTMAREWIKLSTATDAAEEFVEDVFVSKTRLTCENLRLNVKSTMLTIALPFSFDHVLDAKPREVCAFLPIRTYGLNFYVQADWLLAASREGIRAELQW